MTDRVVALQQPEKDQRHDLHRHHADERLAEAGAGVGSGRVLRRYLRGRARHLRGLIATETFPEMRMPRMNAENAPANRERVAGEGFDAAVSFPGAFSAFIRVIRISGKVSV